MSSSLVKEISNPEKKAAMEGDGDNIALKRRAEESLKENVQTIHKPSESGDASEADQPVSKKPKEDFSTECRDPDRKEDSITECNDPDRKEDSSTECSDPDKKEIDEEKVANPQDTSVTAESQEKEQSEAEEKAVVSEKTKDSQSSQAE